MQDAGWVGLGWNLNAGGVITRIPQGAIDNTRQNGYNYGQYSLSDSLLQANNSNFLKYCYSNDSVYSYDVAPDIFCFNFNGYFGKFYWYNGKAYLLAYNKEIKIDWPSISGSITITTGDGTIYTFGTWETTFLGIKRVGGIRNYTSAWDLTRVVSADKKDTILLNYNSYQWKQFPSPYNNSYVQGTGVYNDLIDTTVHVILPVISAQILSSITCRTTQVNFIPSATVRTDVDGTYPSLGEIDVKDSVTKKIIKKNVFSYAYFGDSTTYSNKTFLRLKLNGFSTVSPVLFSDAQAYSFKYINENNNNSFPDKGTLAIDYWGFYNGAEANTGLFPDTLAFGTANREPDSTYSSYGALDTVFYPTGAFTTFDYEQNRYYASATQNKKAGPGIRVKSISQFQAGATTCTSQKRFFYNADDGVSSSSALLNIPNFSGPAYNIDDSTYNTFIAYNNAAGSGVINNVFYYKKVTEQESSGNEIHRSDYYFNSFSNLYTDVELSKKTDYRYDAATGLFKPASVTSANYSTVQDSSFLVVNPYIQSAHTNFNGTYSYVYNYTYSYQPTYWKYITSQKTVSYDILNDSLVTGTDLYYNTSRNADSTVQTLPDGRKYIIKLKYPESYTSNLTGNMVSSHVISPVIEKQTWLQNGAGAPNLISGRITLYDQSIFKPVSIYAVETTVPFNNLSSETRTSGKFNTLISDATRYVLKEQFTYDNHNNLSQATKTNDAPVSYLYDYNYSIPVATVTNAASNEIAYTSFEADGTGRWSVASVARDTNYSITGTKSYNLSNGSISITGLVPSHAYIVSYWSKAGSYTVTGSTGTITGKTINGWTYVEHTVANTTSVTISGSSNIDELRLYPAASQMKSSTFQPLVGISSFDDASGTLSYYEYDGFNRIKDIKDADKNVVKVYEYQVSQPYTYYNDALSGVFQKNNCPCGQYGSSVTYTVPANTYNSHAGKADANRKAQDDINANGQNYANTAGSGTCTNIPCSGVDKKITYCVCETGVKVYTSSVWQPAQHQYLCTYHYEWSDGGQSSNYTEYSKTSCAILN